MLRRAVIVMAVVAFGAVGTAPARADQTPGGCTKNALSLDITKDKTLVRAKDVITYGIIVGNAGAGACNITGAVVQFAVPGPTGAPADLHTVGTVDLPAGTAPHQIATVRYTVPAVTSVIDLVARGEAHGVLHDAPTNHSADVVKTIGTTAFAPAMALTKTGSTTGGLAPQTVTYTYTLRNTSTVSQALPDVPIANPAVSDNLCAPLAYINGDTNGDKLLNVNETWVFTCTTTYTTAGCYTNVANGTGTATVGDTKYPVGAGPVTWTVCVTVPPPPPAPPAPPEGGVQGATATQPGHCVTLAQRSLKVRAKELTTVRVRVRVNGKGIAKSRVRLSGPGVNRSARTNKHGMATFHVRPKKSGRLTIHSDQCAVAARVAVKPARRVVSPALPQVTG